MGKYYIYCLKLGSHGVWTTKPKNHRKQYVVERLGNARFNKCQVQHSTEPSSPSPPTDFQTAFATPRLRLTSS